MSDKIGDLKAQHLIQHKNELERIKKELIELGAQKIILFGSGARGELGLLTDLDLIVIIPSNKTYIERSQEIYKNIQPSEVDLLIYTPKEFEHMIKNNLFIQHVLKEGKVLFETA
jgi:predicted nucleotidyltransferase